MTDQNKNSQLGSLASSGISESQPTVTTAKRPFMEPEISQPVDVLEATTFFQAVDSGATN